MVDEKSRTKERIKKRTIYNVLMTAVLILGGLNNYCYVYGQSQGLKYYRNFSSDEYIYQPQNWCILQDHRGYIYVANNGGVMEYDGMSWKLIKVPNQVVRSLAIDESGTIYVGGIDELGILEADSEGVMKYRSLLEHIDKYKKNFRDVWRINSTKQGVFFRTSEYIFRWDTQTKKMDIPLETLKGENYYFNASFSCHEKYYLNQRTIGLMQYVNGAFKLLRGGEALGTIKRIFLITPYGDSGKNLLIGSGQKGFFIYDGTKIERFPTEVDNYIIENVGYHGTILSNPTHDIAIATLSGGLVVMNRQGKLKYLFNKELGMLENSAKYVFEDTQGNLWLALSNGISRVEYSSPLTVFNDYTGLPGMVLSVTKNKNGVYAGTTQGLFLLKQKDNRFKRIPQITDACWSLVARNNSVLAATDNGVLLVDADKIHRITTDTALVLQPSRTNSRLIWVGMLNNLGTLILNSSKGTSSNEMWSEGPGLEKINKQIRTIVEDRDGNLWLGLLPAGVIKVSFPVRDNINVYKTTLYDSSFSLPQGEIKVFRVAGHVLFASKESPLLRFDNEKKQFIADFTLGQSFSSSLLDVFRVLEDKNGVIWFHAKGRNYRAVPQGDGSFKIDDKSLARIPVAAQVNSIFCDPRENVTWFATNKGLIRYDAGLKQKANQDYYTIISQVVINGTPKYNNLYNSNSQFSNSLLENKHTPPGFSYKERNLRFELRAPFFIGESRTTFSYRLEGYENQWTHRQKEGFKEYTNLDAGEYIFRVKAKNVYGEFGREATFFFKILPPWYRTWWAFLSYGVLFSLGLFLTVKWRLRKLKQEKKRLEQLVDQRTKEIKLKNLQLEEQTQQLIHQAEKLKELDHAKSRFFANISHEFRTPLTLILGPLEQVMSKRLSEPVREKLNLMHQNSHRLLKLINRLLELSRIDSGKMKLRAAKRDIIPFINGILASFEHQADESKLNLEFKPQYDSVYLCFDSEKMEEVLTNLISNAVKFTPSQGKIFVSVKQFLEKEEDFPGGYLEISIKDTGVGIPREQLAHIFDRFFQVESHERKHKGSGIGLALTRELVLLHHGKIDVNSSVGEDSGSEFILRFPLGKGHLNPEEIAGTLTEKSSPTEEKQNFTKEIEGNISSLSDEEPEELPVELQETGIRHTNEDTSDIREKHTILVVEDSPGMRQFIRESIKTRYRVVEAEDGQMGWEKAQELMPDLIISDIMMPHKDGYELCRDLKTNLKTSHIPVILLTAKASDVSKLEGIETGADDYIVKPFNMKILLSRIKNLIDLRRQLHAKIQKETLLDPDTIDVSPLDKKFIEQLHRVLEKYISDEGINVEHLSKKMDISRVTLNKKIQALTGESATEFIRSFRLKRAMQLLKENFGNVLEVSQEVGFSNPSYFARCFKEMFHILPSEVKVESVE